MMNDYEIKQTGEPVTYGDGAIRNTKEGKGRYDLIPMEPMTSIMNAYHDKNFIAEIDAIANEDAFIVTLYKYAFNRKFAYVIILLSLGNDIHGCGFHIFSDEIGEWFASMIEYLAEHFEKGAKIYGEHNCEKGIPLESFIDSGLRHMTQYINVTGDREENHWIAAIWNFWMAEWTMLKQNKSLSDVTSGDEFIDIGSLIMNSIFGENASDDDASEDVTEE